MANIAISVWWVVGWAVGFGGAVIAALLLVSIIRLARTIVSQAQDVAEAIDGAQRNTTALFDVTSVNLALDRLTRGLRALRTGRAP